jgi:hypothetical protein
MVRPADGRDCVEDHEMPELERRAWIAWNRRALSLAQIKSLIALGLIYSEKQGHLWVVGGDVGAWLWPNGTTADLRGTARCVLCEERWPLVGDLAPMPECPRKADAEAAKIDGAAAGAS